MIVFTSEKKSCRTLKQVSLCTVLPAKSDSGVMFFKQSLHELIIECTSQVLLNDCKQNITTVTLGWRDISAHLITFKPYQKKICFMVSGKA